MGETFYTVLGVGDEAGPETIRRAYRDHVKETHPDVSDNPDAGWKFKRITTARDVLLDGDERARYDMLGHDAYVRGHVSDSAWQTGRSTNPDSDGNGAATSSPPEPHDERTATAETARDGRDSRTNSPGQGASESEQSATKSSWGTTYTRGHSRTDGGYTTQSWQTASQAYRRSPSDSSVENSSSLWETLVSVRKLGPWLAVHVVLIASALATSWSTFTASAQNQSITTVLFGLILVTLVIVLSMIHVSVRIYA